MAEAQEALSQEEQDEYAEAAAAQDALSGYENTRTADVEDQREYRLIPAKTACELGVAGFEYLPAKGQSAAALTCKIEVVAPEEYADGSSNFRARFSLNPVVGKNPDGSSKKRSGWDMTVDQLSYIYASVNQCSAREGKAEMIDCVLAEFPNLTPDDVVAFHVALTENANEKLKGRTFKTKGIGIQRGGENPKGGQYPDRQEFGTFDYPKASKK